MLWGDSQFDKGQGCKNRRNKALLVVFNSAAYKFSVLFDYSPRVAFPLGQVSGRNNIQMAHNPEPFLIVFSGNGNNQIRAYF